MTSRATDAESLKQLKENRIGTSVTPQEIADFTRSSASDFAFEMQCLQVVEDSYFECVHGGSYADPLQKKNRQFDIRATCDFQEGEVLAAIECKNISDVAPLVVTTTPRNETEIFHQRLRLYALSPQAVGTETVPAFPGSVYEFGKPVGKDCQQIKWTKDGLKTLENGKPQEGIYDKWSQALASLEAAVDEKISQGKPYPSPNIEFVLLPVIVVPNGTLWVAEFDERGRLTGDPMRRDRCSFFVRKEFRPSGRHSQPFCISHIEFVTIDGCRSLLTSFREDRVRKSTWFSNC